MVRKSQAPEQVTEVGELPISEWDKMWELIPNGFLNPQPQLRNKVGLWAAKRDGRFMYIAAAANMRGSGLSGGLARAYFANASGDAGHGRKMLLEHRASLDAYVIKMERSSENISLIKLLKQFMIERHLPAWNQSAAIISARRAAAYAKQV